MTYFEENEEKQETLSIEEQAARLGISPLRFKFYGGVLPTPKPIAVPQPEVHLPTRTYLRLVKVEGNIKTRAVYRIEARAGHILPLEEFHLMPETTVVVTPEPLKGVQRLRGCHTLQLSSICTGSEIRMLGKLKNKEATLSHFFGHKSLYCIVIMEGNAIHLFVFGYFDIGEKHASASKLHRTLPNPKSSDMYKGMFGRYQRGDENTLAEMQSLINQSEHFKAKNKDCPVYFEHIKGTSVLSILK
ncbi:hypothetical protein GCM10027037_12490 [Mucilaginibacter koreensis]